MTEEQNDYETFPYDSFVKDLIIDFEDEYEIEEGGSGVTIEMAKAETELTESEAKKPYHSRVWEYFEKTSIKGENNNVENYILYNVCKIHLSANNSTTTLECHLKSKHRAEYDNLKQKVEVKSEPWASELQKEKHVLFINWIITD